MLTKLSHDIEKSASHKLASIADYIRPSLTGAGILTAAAAAPALLNAYVNEENPLKTLASAAQYTIPIGMAMGAGYVPVSKLEALISSIGSKIPDMSRVPEQLLNSPVMQDISGISKLIGSEMAESGRDILGLIR